MKAMKLVSLFTSRHGGSFFHSSLMIVCIIMSLQLNRKCDVYAQALANISTFGTTLFEVPLEACFAPHNDNIAAGKFSSAVVLQNLTGENSLIWTWNEISALLPHGTDAADIQIELFGAGGVGSRGFCNCGGWNIYGTQVVITDWQCLPGNAGGSGGYSKFTMRLNLAHGILLFPKISFRILNGNAEIHVYPALNYGIPQIFSSNPLLVLQTTKGISATLSPTWYDCTGRGGDGCCGVVARLGNSSGGKTNFVNQDNVISMFSDVFTVNVTEVINGSVGIGGSLSSTNGPLNSPLVAGQGGSTGSASNTPYPDMMGTRGEGGITLTLLRIYSRDMGAGSASNQGNSTPVSISSPSSFNLLTQCPLYQVIPITCPFVSATTISVTSVSSVDEPYIMTWSKWSSLFPNFDSVDLEVIFFGAGGSGTKGLCGCLPTGCKPGNAGGSGGYSKFTMRLNLAHGILLFPKISFRILNGNAEIHVYPALNYGIPQIFSSNPLLVLQTTKGISATLSPTWYDCTGRGGDGCCGVVARLGNSSGGKTNFVNQDNVISMFSDVFTVNVTEVINGSVGIGGSLSSTNGPLNSPLVVGQGGSTGGKLMINSRKLTEWYCLY